MRQDITALILSFTLASGAWAQTKGTSAEGYNVNGLVPQGSEEWVLETDALSPARQWTGNPSDPGSFRTRCFLSHYAMDDPVMLPGKPGESHLHVFFGASDTDANTTHTTLRNGTKSTCAGGNLNRTAYWAPAVLTDKKWPIPASNIFVYYKPGAFSGEGVSQIQTIPDGLVMIAGDMNAIEEQTFDDWKFDHDVAGWYCAQGHESDPNIEHHKSIPNCPKGTRLVMMLVFPQCWNGRDVDSPDHKSHMAYPAAWGQCPVTHPVAISEITYFIEYPVVTENTEGWHLSSDMYDLATKPGGLSFHADWLDGWDTNLKKEWLENCVKVGGNPCDVNIIGNGRELTFNDSERARTQVDFNYFLSKIGWRPVAETIAPTRQRQATQPVKQHRHH